MILPLKIQKILRSFSFIVKIDQEDLQEKEKLSPEDKIAFHPYATSSEEE